MDRFVAVPLFLFDILAKKPELILTMTFLVKQARFTKGTTPRGQKLEPGELVTGRDELAKLLDRHPSSVYRELQTLKKLGLIELKTDNRKKLGTIVKINDFERYRPPKRTRKRQQKASEPNIKPNTYNLPTCRSTSTVAVDHSKIDWDRVLADACSAASKLGPPNRRNWNLICKAAALTQLNYSQQWFASAVEGVVCGNRVKRPYGYLWTTLLNSADRPGQKLKRDLKALEDSLPFSVKSHYVILLEQNDQNPHED